MTSVISFTLKDIGFFVLWGLVAIILYYIIILLKNLYSTLKDVNKIIEKNQNNVDKILNEAPGITQNVNSISKELADTLPKFRGTVNNIAETTESVTETINENDTINKQLTSIFSTISMIKKLADKFLNDDKKENNNQNEKNNN